MGIEVVAELIEAALDVVHLGVAETGRGAERLREVPAVDHQIHVVERRQGRPDRAGAEVALELAVQHLAGAEHSTYVGKMRLPDLLRCAVMPVSEWELLADEEVALGVHHVGEDVSCAPALAGAVGCPAVDRGGAHDLVEPVGERVELLECGMHGSTFAQQQLPAIEETRHNHRVPGDRIDPDEPAHLRDERGHTPPIGRYLPDVDLEGVVRRHWIPVWSLPAGEVSVQRVLQYPVCLLSIGPDEAVLVGPATGLGTRELKGSGWTVGTLLQPAAGQLLLGDSVATITDAALPLTALTSIDGAALAAEVRRHVAEVPGNEQAQRAAVAAVEEALRGLLPVDAEGDLVNRIVEFTESNPQVRRVGHVCDEFGLSERTLQRLTARRLGLSPKWLIQRRRLHEAAARLRERSTAFDLAAVAADLGYADQAHFIRDFAAVTGLTPGKFAAETLRSADSSDHER